MIDFVRAHNDYLDPDRHLNYDDEETEARRQRVIEEASALFDDTEFDTKDRSFDEPSELPDVGTSVPESPTLTCREWEDHLIDMSDTAAEFDDY